MAIIANPFDGDRQCSLAEGMDDHVVTPVELIVHDGSHHLSRSRRTPGTIPGCRRRPQDWRAMADANRSRALNDHRFPTGGLPRVGQATGVNTKDRQQKGPTVSERDETIHPMTALLVSGDYWGPYDGSGPPSLVVLGVPACDPLSEACAPNHYCPVDVELPIGSGRIKRLVAFGVNEVQALEMAFVMLRRVLVADDGNGLHVG